MSSLKKLISAGIAAAMAVTGLAADVSALEAYDPYSYDRWGDPVASQAGYTAELYVDGETIGCGNFFEPADLYVSHDNLMYIADKGNNRIVITDLDFNYIREMKEFTLSDELTGSISPDAAALTSAGLESGSYTLVYGSNVYVDETEKKNPGFKVTELSDEENTVAVPAECVTIAGGFRDGDKVSLEGGKVTKVTTGLKKPTGVFVDQYTGIIYICDTENDRVVKCDTDGTIDRLFTKPESELYDQTLTYQPSKVLADKAGNVYVVVKSQTKGAVMFDINGEFQGFYGANRVEQTAEVLANAFWNLIATEEQKNRRAKQTPIGFCNFDIDDDGFIYTVTDSQEVTTDLVKKLNPRGDNILDSVGGGADDAMFGDISPTYYSIYAKKSSLTDIDIGPNGELNILDFQHGRVFQYDKECWLMFIMGGSGDQLGLFQSATAIESYDNKLYVLDSRKNNITVFARTVFGEIVTEATNLYNDGLYEESLEPWQNVLKYDGNYRRAYIGIGNALYNDYQYEEAMRYYKISISRKRYNKAYEGYRDQWLRDNYILVVLIVVVVIALLITYSQLRKRKKIVYPWEKRRRAGA